VIQFKELNKSLQPNSKLQKLSTSIADSLQKIAVSRLTLADNLENNFCKPTRDLAADVNSKFSSKKIDEEIQKEIEYQNARRDEQYYEALKSLSKSYIDFFENCTKNFVALQDQINQLEKTNAKVSIQRSEMVGEPIFGVRLELLKRPVPSDIERLIDYIEANYLEKEGIYRVPGGLEVIKKLKTQMDTGVPFDEIVAPNMQEKPFVMCGLLKLWVRELPEPLLTTNNFDECIYIAKLEDTKRRTDIIANILDTKIPPTNKKVLGRLMAHFAKVCEHEKLNKMNPQSISVVFGMNILKPKKEDPTLLATNATSINKITQILIQNVTYLFNSDENQRKERLRGASFRLEMSLLEDKPRSTGSLKQLEKSDDDLEKWIGENGEKPEINTITSPKGKIHLTITPEPTPQTPQEGDDTKLLEKKEEEGQPKQDVTAIEDLENWLLE
jgi:hypothetical protein